MKSVRFIMSQTSKIRPVVVCGPSGSGKSSLIIRIIKEHPEKFALGVSHTTRKPRAGEIDKIHYNFIDRRRMEDEIKRGEFIEYATYCDNLYGTSKNAILNIIKSGKVCILDIDVQGAEQIRKLGGIDPLLIFIKPASIDELMKRLRARKTETEESLAKRLEVAKMEIKDGLQPGNYQFVITNEDFEKAYMNFKEIIFRHFRLCT